MRNLKKQSGSIALVSVILLMVAVVTVSKAYRSWAPDKHSFPIEISTSGFSKFAAQDNKGAVIKWESSDVDTEEPCIIAANSMIELVHKSSGLTGKPSRTYKINQNGHRATTNPCEYDVFLAGGDHLATLNMFRDIYTEIERDKRILKALTESNNNDK